MKGGRKKKNLICAPILKKKTNKIKNKISKNNIKYLNGDRESKSV